jgi:hypothetical protein
VERECCGENYDTSVWRFQPIFNLLFCIPKSRLKNNILPVIHRSSQAPRLGMEMSVPAPVKLWDVPGQHKKYSRS